MPPRERYTREQIVDAAMALVQKEGLPSLNARGLAAQLGSSTQPIFRHFSHMEEVRQAVLDRANRVYNRYMRMHLDEKPYKSAGLAYIRFAAEEKALFRLLFMRDRRREDLSGEQDANLDAVLDAIQAAAGLDRETARAFHLQMWIFTHGLAVMLATDYLPISYAEAGRLLTLQFEAMKGRYQNGKQH